MNDKLEEKQTKNKLAVFEHIPCKEKKNNNKNKRGYKRALSPSSDSGLVIDDEDSQHPTKKRVQGVRLVKEPLSLECGWNSCEEVFDSYRKYNYHVKEHAENDCAEGDEMMCKWRDCTTIISEKSLLSQHVSYHGYHTKLKNIGKNVLGRRDLPDCTREVEEAFPLYINGYSCDWKECGGLFEDVYEFHEHIKLHINSNPKYCKKDEIIECLWQGCSYKCSSQYKLSDHLKMHTKEKVVACPTCGAHFAGKTKFYDHRKRQLPPEVQNYQCSQCSKFFPSERLLRDHMRTHINHYKCTMCDMTCPKPSALAIHFRYRHLNERPLQCHLCSYMAVTKQALDAHLITHCTESLLACEDCDYRCRSFYGLDKHYQKVHGLDLMQTYECHCCQAKFQRGNYLTRHLIKAHDFHWPSGHSRFRYKEDADGIFRLQTVRYESIEVTQEMMSSTNTTSQPVEVQTNKRYNLRKKQQSSDKTPNYVLMVAENGEQNVVCPTKNNIVMTINDIDESGNILNSEILQSQEMQIVPNTKGE
ncbi:hypothetical protein PPYR_09168 [Photinus pyralis]|uniref:C2H2-type domain-containing protein n=5 Tax=Photinus pyralis TaxID=7054 RepID=A0A5N4ALD9_PHOPY|nr:histone H4 transcription factor-like [Photinus pyralis]KAB0798175.1 hypothetical protein PPYR_09168 [Photinus pyralis]